MEQKNKAKITIKMISKIIGEFNLITKVAPKPIQYNKLRPKVRRFGGVTSSLKRTEIEYSTELIELLKFLISTGAKDQYSKLENSKLYTVIERILMISDQKESEVETYRTKSFKCLKDIMSFVITDFEKFNNQIKYQIISFLYQISQILKKLVFENTIEKLINKEAFLVLMIQILNPIDLIYKKLRYFIVKDTKGLLDLSPQHKWMIYHTIVFSKNLFSIFNSQSELEKSAQNGDKLIPPIDNNLRYDFLVSLQEAFVFEIMSVPRVGQYMYIMLRQKDFDNLEDENEAKCYKQFLGQIDDLHFKNLFNSFHFSKISRITDHMPLEEEKIESKSEHDGTLLPESEKNEKKMFIFANVFVLLNKYFIKAEHE